MRLQFNAKEIDDTPLSDVEGLLDTATGTLGVFFYKRRNWCSITIWMPIVLSWASRARWMCRYLSQARK